MRVFLALWPGTRAQEQLEAEARLMAAEFGGRPMPAAKIHLTLVFLGELTPERAMEVFEVARAVRWAPFMARLDRWGGFRRSKVGWAGSARPASELLDMQARLEAGLRAAGFALEERPFAPHVTLVRKVERPVAAREMVPVQWKAQAVALVRTEPGTGMYESLAELPAEG